MTSFEKITFGKKMRIFWVVCASLLFFWLGWTAQNYYRTHISPSRSIQLRENPTEYSFINPLLLIDNSKIEFFDYAPMETDINSYISQAKRDGGADKVSVYYRDLNNGRWAGIDEKEKYVPSSMLKVPTLIAYLKIAENNPDVLSERVYYAPTEDPGQFYKPSSYLAPGTYQIRTLLQEMIIKSENTAVKTLDDLHTKEALEVYSDLHLPDPVTRNNQDEDFMSPEDYSKIFQVLYNASYLSQAHSEDALKLLTFSEFNGGLVKGIPTDIEVAHKFGEHTKTVNGIVAERQLHDCGIVYYPDHQYFLCIMTKGQDFTKLQKVLSDISKIVFDDVSKKYPMPASNK